MFVYLYMDQDGVLRYILAVGCVLSYVAVVVNVIVFTILCRKTLVYKFKQYDTTMLTYQM
jgi:hypothetical protein